MTTRTEDFKEVRVSTEFTRSQAQMNDQLNLIIAYNSNHALLYQLYIEIEEHEMLWPTETRRQKHKQMRKLIDEMMDQLQLARNYY